MDFATLLAMLANPEEGVEVPATIYDDLSLAYTDDVSARDAKIAEYETGMTGHADELAAKDAEIARLKSLMFDKLMATPNDNGGESEDDESDDETPNEDGPTGVAALFE